MQHTAVSGAGLALQAPMLSFTNTSQFWLGIQHPECEITIQLPHPFFPVEKNTNKWYLSNNFQLQLDFCCRYLITSSVLTPAVFFKLVLRTTKETGNFQWITNAKIKITPHKIQLS